MMANFHVGSQLIEDDSDDEVGTKERRISLQKKRHYKKDSRFLYDLYTLTFDENESVDEIALTCPPPISAEDQSLQLQSVSTPSSPTPSSRGSNLSTIVASSLNYQGPSPSTNAVLKRKTIPSLETNLHKILARKFLDSEEVSFKKAKLLTKAYYQLLRTNSSDVITTQLQAGDAFQSLSVTPHSKRSYSLLRSVSSKRMMAPPSTRARDDRLAWPALLGANNSELARMATGLNNTVKALNDYLMELLQERDSLLSQQDEMLENISELTDSLL